MFRRRKFPTYFWWIFIIISFWVIRNYSDFVWSTLFRGHLAFSNGSSSKAPTSPTAKASLPSCIVIGVRKGGTRALLDMIGLHSKVKVARNEVHFFDKEDNYAKGLEWYKSQLPAIEKDEISVEKTPNYFVTTSVVPGRILRMDKRVQLLLVVRDPVTRLISDYTQILTNHQERGLTLKPFEEIALDSFGNVNKKYDAVEKSKYSVYMKKWLKFFPRNQILVVNGDRLIRKPWQELRKVETFLGLEHEITQEDFFFNATKGFHCINRNMKERCLTSSKGRQHPDVSQAVVSKLRQYYAPFNYEFYNLVGRDFGWPES